MIDFHLVEEQIIEHMRDGEGEVSLRIVADDQVRILRGKLAPGCSIGMHCHDTSAEVIYILAGVGTVVLGDNTEEVLPAGTCHYCRKGESHSLQNRSEQDVEFFAVIPLCV